MIGISKYMCHVRAKRKKQNEPTLPMFCLSEPYTVQVGLELTLLVQDDIKDAPASACQMLGRWECVSTPTGKTSLRQMFGWLRPSNTAKLLWEGARVQLYT